MIQHSENPKLTTSFLRVITILGPWNKVISKPNLYEVFERAFRETEYNKAINDLIEIMKIGETKFLQYSKRSKKFVDAEIGILPTFQPLPAMLTTSIPRMNVLGSLAGWSWLAIVIDNLGPSGYSGGGIH
jgi:hypothetical protein